MPLDLRRFVSNNPAAAAAMARSAPLEVDLDGAPATPRELFIRGCAESGVLQLAAALHRTPTVWAAGSFGLGPIVAAAARASHSASPAIAASLARSTTDLVRSTMSSVLASKPGVQWIADAAEEPVEAILPNATYIYILRDGRDAIVAAALRQLESGGPLFSDQRYRARLENIREELRRDTNLLTTQPHRLLRLETWVRQLSRAWAAHVQTDLAALDRMTAAGANCLVVRYEDLVSGNATALAPLASLLNLTPSACRIDTGPSNLFSAVGAWQRFFTRQTAEAFFDEAGDTFTHLYNTSATDPRAWIATLPNDASALIAPVPSRSEPSGNPISDDTIVLHASPASLASPGVPEHTITINGIARSLFFICGHPRSGTTWTVAALNLHPRIFAQGEFRFEALRQAFDQLTRWPWHVAHHEPVRTEAERAGRDAIRRIMGAIAVHKPAAAWLGDKTPRPLRVLLPGAPHILLLRDGRDVLISRTFHELSTGGSLLADPLYAGRMLTLQQQFLADPDLFRREPHRLLAEEHWVRTLARQWAHQMRHDLAVAARMRADGVTPIHELRYERMRADVESERAALYRFLGLDPAEAAPVSAANRSAPGFKSETPNAFYRKGEVGDWTNYFSDAARRWFKQAAGDQLIALGYERDDSW